MHTERSGASPPASRPSNFGTWVRRITRRNWSASMMALPLTNCSPRSRRQAMARPGYLHLRGRPSGNDTEPNNRGRPQSAARAICPALFRHRTGQSAAYRQGDVSADQRDGRRAARRQRSQREAGQSRSAAARLGYLIRCERANDLPCHQSGENATGILRWKHPSGQDARRFAAGACRPERTADLVPGEWRHGRDWSGRHRRGDPQPLTRQICGSRCGLWR